MSEEQLLFWKKAMFPEIAEREQEIERLNNIIKEVREELIVLFGTDDKDINNILEILDKGE